MIQPAPENSFCGSRLSPDQKYILDFVSHLKCQCQQGRPQDTQTLVAAHNAMATYTLEMLSFVTGHRSVSDPLYSFDLFNITHAFVLIEDKVVSTRHQARVAWLPPLAQQQVLNYLSHLRSLSRLIRLAHPDLAHQILAITEPNYPRPLTLFFFLQESDGEVNWVRIKPSSLKMQLGNSWQLPLNTNRHLLSTWLHSTICPPELIDAQLGHVEVGCYEFGARSPLAPVTVKNLMLPFLEQYLAAYGWKAVSGVQAPSRIRIVNPARSSSLLVQTTTFGTEARASIREGTLHKDSEAVLELFNNKFPSGIPQAIPDALVEEMLDAITLDSPKNRALVRLTILRRHLSKIKKAGTDVMVPGRLAIVRPEPSVFSIDFAQTVTEFEEIRDKFIYILGNRVGDTPDQEIRIAEILVSACIFGAQSSPDFLNEITHGLVGRIYRLGDEAFADVSYSATSPIRRWFPDCMTWALFIGYSKIATAETAAPSTEKVKKNLIELLKNLLGHHYKKTSTRQSVSDLLSPLLGFTKPWWRFHLPGVIRAYAEGEIFCASVPLSNWLRLRTDENGSISPTTVSSSIYTSFDDTPIINELPPTTEAYKKSLWGWDEIKKVIGSHDNRSGTNENNQRSSARKNRIESRALSLLDNSSAQLSSVAQLIAAWIIHLCRHGTKAKSNLAAGSITTYARTIGPALIGLTHNSSLLTLPDFEIEETYRQLLDTSHRKNLGYVAARLKEFHSFLENSYGVPQLDWSEVVGDGFEEADSVDAGIVTLEQYEFALHSLLTDSDYPSRDQLIHAAVLFFGYRFGLRAGEIFRLTVSDLLISEDEMVIYIRNSVYGETKTDNGVRQLPLIGSLSKEESDLVRILNLHIETYSNGDPLAGLFTQFATQRDIVDRRSCVTAVVDALRNATGDNETRLRHLRHSCATRVFLSMMLEEVPTGLLGDVYKSLWGVTTPQQIRALLVGDSRLSRRGIYAMALYMGHGSPDTTHRHYVHLADLLLKDCVDRQLISTDDKASAYAFQSSYSNIRQLRSRMGNRYSFRSMAQHFTLHSSIPSLFLQKYDRTTTNAIEDRNSKSSLTPADIDRILLLATMRKSTEGLADRFLTTDSNIHEVLSIASNLQEETGFTDFALSTAHTEDDWLPVEMKLLDTLDKESFRVRRFLDRIYLSDADILQLNSALSIWANSHYPNASCLLIQKRSEIQQILEVMQLIGISSCDFEALIPVVDDENYSDYWTRAEEWLTSVGLKVNHAARLPLSYSKLRTDNRIGLILRASESHQLGYQRTLNRALFIASIWIKGLRLKATQPANS